MKKSFILLTVFITGAGVLVIEVVAVRILSPFFGNTIYTYSSVITVILAALSFGYYFGGRLADRHPSFRWFYGLIVSGGLSVFILQIISWLFLPALGSNLSIINGPLIVSSLLFFLPAVLLGTLSPYAIKLLGLKIPLEQIGRLAGEVFFWSTAGSIFGSLVTGFYLIPHFGINKIVIGTGIILFILGVVGLGAGRLSSRARVIILAVGVGLIATLYALGQLVSLPAGTVYQADGLYEKLTIYDDVYGDQPARFLFQDRSFSSAIYLNSDEVVFDYTKYYSLYKILNPESQKILVIGGGAYTIPKLFLQAIPTAAVAVVEIEPELYHLSQKYFKLKASPRLKNYTADGRRFLTTSQEKYDVIFGDAFYSLSSIPSHLTTQEFFKLVKNKLAPKGLFIANFIGDLEPRFRSLIYSEIKTITSVFDNCYFFAARSPRYLDFQNIIFVCAQSDEKFDFKKLAAPKAFGADNFFSQLPGRLVDLRKVDLSPYPIFTDNFAPVEYYTAQGLKKLK